MAREPGLDTKPVAKAPRPAKADGIDGGTHYIFPAKGTAKTELKDTRGDGK